MRAQVGLALEAGGLRDQMVTAAADGELKLIDFRMLGDTGAAGMPPLFLGPPRTFPPFLLQLNESSAHGTLLLAVIMVLDVRVARGCMQLLAVSIKQV
jgi:hypothetical protein